jgi:S1-C subfamily serine protease
VRDHERRDGMRRLLLIEAPRDRLKPIPIGTSEDLRVGQSVYAVNRQGRPVEFDVVLERSR